MTVASTSKFQHHSHSSNNRSEKELSFHSVKSSSSSYTFVEKVFKQKVQPLFGAQEGALAKIKARQDHRCELLQQGDKRIGLIVYKMEPQNEYADHGVSDSFELKNLLVLDSEDQSVKNVDLHLLNRIKKLAKRKFAKGIHALVQKNDTNLVDFLECQGFSVAKKFKRTTSDEMSKYLMSYKLSEKKQKSSTSSTSRVTETLNEKIPKRKREPSPQRRQSDEAHQPEKRRGTAKEVEEFRSPVRPRSYSRDYGQSSQPRYSGGYQRDSRRYSTGSTTVSNGQYGQARPREVTLKAKYIHQIQSGQKTIEGRINSGQFRHYRVGEQVRFFYNQNPRDDVHCRIKGIRNYRSFREMLETEGYQKCLSDVRSLEEAVRVYDNIPNFVQRAAQSGVLAIEVEVI